jgi:DNA-binding NtrC family response regulator
MTAEEASTVLVVDDEEPVREFIESALDRAGYNHVSCNDPKEALNFFKANFNKVDAVITDLSMPQLSGLQLAREFFSIKPDISIILFTGRHDPVPADLVDTANRIARILFKPFSPKELVEILEGVLAHKRQE